MNNPLWWKGPIWLQNDPKEWKTTPIQPLKTEDVPKIKPQEFGFVTVTKEDNFMSKFSSLARLRAVTAWCLRPFKTQSQKRKGEPTFRGELVPEKLKLATVVLVKIIQKDEFKT